MSTERPTDEPESSQSFDDLFGSPRDFMAWVTSGPKDEAEEKKELLSPEDLAIQSRYGKHFCGTFLNPTMIFTLDRREVVGRLPDRFIRWKEAMQTMGQRGQIDRRTAELIEALTINQLALIAAEEFKKAAKDTGGQLLGSKELEQARNYTEYWSRLQEITREVAEDEERKRNS